MHTEYSIVNYDREGQKIKHIGKILPYGRRAVLPYAFSVKTVALRMAKVKPGVKDAGIGKKSPT